MMNGTAPASKDAARKRPLVDIENSSEVLNPPNVTSSSVAAKQAISTRTNPYSSTKKKKPATNDNDEDVLVLSPPRPPSRPTSSDGNNTTTTKSGTSTNNSNDEDCVMEWSNATNNLVVYPHGRPHCGVHSFSEESNRIKHCDKCFCVLCDVPAKDCPDWENHCQETKKLTADGDSSDSDEEENSEVIDVDQNNSPVNPAMQSYNNRRAFQALRANPAGARSASALDDDDWAYGDLEGSNNYDNHYSNEFNHAYNNKDGRNERGRHPKDMRITEVLAQKLHEALQLSEGTSSMYSTSADTSGDSGFVSRSEQRKKRFDQCKMEGDIPQLGLHRSFFVSGVRLGWPYPSILMPQRQMAIHLIKALKNSHHVVLESPTGTGKSAAILCAVLAWQRHHAKSIWGKSVGPDSSKNTALGMEPPSQQEKFPRIIYCSRTHSQVAQMVASLKKTPYRPRMTVLGSRDRLCIHKEIRNKNPPNPDSSQDQSNNKRVNVNTACQVRVANTEKIRKSLWKSYDYPYDDNRPPESLPGDGNGGNASQEEEDEVATGDREHSSEWILKSSTKKISCPHYRQLSSARTAQMTRSKFLVNQNTIDCCKSGGEKTKLGVNDIEDLVSFGLNPYLEESVALYRRNDQESFGIDVGADCRIQAIRDDSPAKFNGQLRRGDTILAVNGKKCPSVSILQREISKTTTDMLELKVLRSTSPSSANTSTSTSTLKQVNVNLLRPDGQNSFGMTLEGVGHTSTGCSVNRVKAEGAAAGNVKAGDVIVSVNGENVERLSYDSIIGRVQATPVGQALSLSLRRQESTVQDEEGAGSEHDESAEDVYNSHAACPYYLSRSLSKHAELLFAPYNYILDPGIRSALDISLDGAVVVLDEGHNVEGTLTESGSGKFGEIELSSLVTMLSLNATAVRSHKNVVQVNGTEKDISELAHELLLFVEQLVLHMRKQKEAFEQSTGNLGAAKAIEEYLQFNTPDNKEFEVKYHGPTGLGVNRKAVGCQTFFDAMKISAPEVVQLLEYAIAMESHLKGGSKDRRGASEVDGGSEKGKNSTFDLLIDLLSKLSLATQTPEHFFISLVVQANGNLDHAAGQESSRGRRFKKKPTHLPFCHPRSLTNPNALLPVCSHKKCKQARSGEAMMRSYRDQGVFHGQWCDGTSIPAWEAHLKVQLLFPGLLMGDLTTKCRTVVLASGSISPLQSVCAELDLRGAEASNPGRLQTKPPPLEANHVINLPQQLLACAIGIFPDGSPLTVNYNNYKHPAFFPRLGTAIASIVESIPSGGTLIFLPSYSLLNKCVKCWNPYGSGSGFAGYNMEHSCPEIWDRFIRSKGKVIVEPTGSQDAFEAARDEYAATIKSDGSCILLAVFRGKMSEGISFNDDNARGVICVGLPFPNAKDRSIVAKKQYNDEQRKLKQRTDLLPGSDWYAQEAYRAVAQALGRCIRHEGDYGTVVLLDSRHCHDGSPGFVHSKLPKWMRHTVRTLSTGNRGRGEDPILNGYHGLKREMERFFARAPAYTESVLAKRRMEFEDAKKNQSSAGLHYDNTTGWSSASSTRITQDSPVTPSFARPVKMENGVLDLTSPASAPSFTPKRES